MENNQSIKMIRMDNINILNPRSRNQKVFGKIVENIKNVGLKRPITVKQSSSKINGKDYDLVCGQGRFEAFLACDQDVIPAIVINATEEQALLMSLIENIARRRHTAMELLQAVEILKSQGYDSQNICKKIGHKVGYVNGIINLLENGEERMVVAVEQGHIPISLAVNIMQAPQDEQKAIQEAYENNQLTAKKLVEVKRLLFLRKKWGKEVYENRKTNLETKGPISSDDVVKVFQKEAEKKRMLTRKAEIVNARLVFLVEAMHCLIQEDHFTTLLRAEKLETMPKQLSLLLSAKGNNE